MSNKDISNYEIDRLLPIGKKEKSLRVNERWIRRKEYSKICCTLRSKTYSYLKDNNDEGKKEKGTKMCILKRKLKFQDYKNCLKASQIVKL